ncbi:MULTISPECIES: phage tail assembly protein [unclassified Streptomyces]|uniref:phage tail assembly protein n=1 Tax=Streptomyces sp. NPDC056835 TaxID=3345956 RepID=UPI00369ABB4F
MANKLTFDDLMTEVEESYKAVEFEGPDGTAYSLRSVLVLPRHERKAVTDAVTIVNSDGADADMQEDAIDNVMLAVVDKPEAFKAVLDVLPLGGKAALIKAWSEATQGPEA